MAATEAGREPDSEHQGTPLELYFDLVFVFAITQVTRVLVDDPTPGGVLRGMLVLAALWWAWGAQCPRARPRATRRSTSERSQRGQPG